MNGPEVSDDELRGVTHDIAALIPAAIARRVRAVPLGFTYDDPPRLRVAMRDPEDPAAVAEVRAVTGHPVIPVRAWNVQMSLALDRLYPRVDIAPPRRVPEATRPPETVAAPALPKPADDWRKTKLPDAVGEDGMLHDGDGGSGHYISSESPAATPRRARAPWGCGRAWRPT